MKLSKRWLFKGTPSIILLLVTSGAFAQNQANVVRETELKAQPFIDAATIKPLSANLKVDVLSQKASWMEVKALGSTGWLKMLSLRFESISPSSKNVLSSVRGLTGESTSTTSVRGFEASDFLKTASPAPEALARMKFLSTSKSDAINFAKQAKLESQTQEYIKTPGVTQ